MKRNTLMPLLLTLIIFYTFANISYAGMQNISNFPIPVEEDGKGEGRTHTDPPLEKGGEGGFERPSSDKKSRDVVIYGVVENFIWQEIIPGVNLLEENGMLYGIGFSSKVFYPSHLTFNARGELFIGKIDYDGSTQSGDKAISKTDYLGMKVEVDQGFNKRINNEVSFEPYFGVGYRGWIRNINDGTTAAGGTATGYTELWQTLYLSAGVRRDIIKENNFRLFSSIGFNMPFFTSNSVRLSEVDPALPDVTLHPWGQLSLNMNAGIRYNRLELLLYYEQMRFSQSGSVSGVFQPASKADIIGIRVGAEL